jgi:tetratricopeptide (TPR) repeat protein
MSNDPAREFIEQATQAVQAGQFENAVQLVDRSIALNPSDPDAHILKGVALSRLGRNEEATAELRSAIQLAPSSSKAFYNLSVHYYGIGEMDRALEMSREAVRLDPGHGPARELITRIEGETGAAHTQQVAPPPGQEQAMQQGVPQQYGAPPQPGYYYRPGYDEGVAGPAHSLAWVEKMGKTWTTAGIVVGLLQGVLWVGTLFSIPKMIQYFQDVMAHPKAKPPPLDLGLMSTPGIQILGVLLTVMILVWTICDLLDRRGNWLWILPLVVGYCCVGMHWIVYMIYIFAGRKRV